MIPKTLNEFAQQCYADSVEAGWWDIRDNPLAVATKLVLIHSEISEALEGFRRDKMDDHLPDRKSIEVELVDVLIRAFDLAGFLNLDLDGAYVEKRGYNKIRFDHKPETRARLAGKKF